MPCRTMKQGVKMNTKITTDTTNLDSWIEIISEDERNPIHIIQPSNTLVQGFVRCFGGGMFGDQAFSKIAIGTGTPTNSMSQAMFSFNMESRGGLPLGVNFTPGDFDPSQLTTWHENNNANALTNDSFMSLSQKSSFDEKAGIIFIEQYLQKVAAGNRYIQNIFFRVDRTSATREASLIARETVNLLVLEQQVVLVRFVLKLDLANFNYNFRRWMTLFFGANDRFVNNYVIQSRWRNTDGEASIDTNTTQGVLKLVGTGDANRSMFALGYSNQAENRDLDIDLISKATNTEHYLEEVRFSAFNQTDGASIGYFDITVSGIAKNTSTASQTYREMALYRLFWTTAAETAWCLTHRAVLRNALGVPEGITLLPNQQGRFSIVFRIYITHQDAYNVNVTSRYPGMNTLSPGGAFFKDQAVTITAIPDRGSVQGFSIDPPVEWKWVDAITIQFTMPANDVNVTVLNTL